jgi:hypothetical protein
VLRGARGAAGPTLVRVAIGPENRQAPYFLPDPVEITLTFQRYLAGRAFQVTANANPETRTLEQVSGVLRLLVGCLCNARRVRRLLDDSLSFTCSRVIHSLSTV